MARRHHILQKGGEIAPDPFVKGRREERQWKHTRLDFEDTRDWDKEEVVRQNYSIGTYPIQEIDEYWWFAKSLMTDYRYRKNNDTYLNWLGYSDKEITEWNSKYLKKGQNPLDINSMVRAYGGPMFLREGVAGWLNTYNENFNFWNVYFKNPDTSEPPVEVLLPETPIEKLNDSLSGGKIPGASGWKWLAHNGNTSNMLPLINNKVITKVVLHFYEPTDFELSFSGDGMESKRFTLKAESAGRNEFDIYVETCEKTSMSISLINGKIRIGKQGRNILHQIALYCFEESIPWGYGHRDWDLGIGIYGRDKVKEFLPEPKGKWHTPQLADVLQLLGQAPNESDDVFLNIMNFIGADSRKDESPYLLPYDQYEDISGLGLYSLSAKGGGYKGGHSGGKPPLVSPIEDSYIDATGEPMNGFGDYGAMHIGDYRGSFGDDPSWEVNTHKRFLFVSGKVLDGAKTMRVDNGFPGAVQSAQVRYCAQKSDLELGYKFYIDEENDQVLMVNFPLSSEDEDLTAELPELPKGLLRGIVLRYTNRLYLKVCKPLSEMRLEEQEILSHIKMDN